MFIQYMNGFFLRALICLHNLSNFCRSLSVTASFLELTDTNSKTIFSVYPSFSVKGETHHIFLSIVPHAILQS